MCFADAPAEESRDLRRLLFDQIVEAVQPAGMQDENVVLLDCNALLFRSTQHIVERHTLTAVEVLLPFIPGRVNENAAADHPVVTRLRHDATARLRDTLGLGVEVTLVPPRTLPRSEGKAVRVVEWSASQATAELP